jgi:Leucine-rich repeat (LRR) protein
VPFSDVRPDGRRVNVSGSLSDDEIERLANRATLDVVQFADPVDPSIWPRLQSGLFSRRNDVMLRVYAHYGGICDLSFLRSLPSLRRFSADRLRSAASIEAVSELKDLRSLSIEIHTLSDFGFLRGVSPHLEKLSLGETEAKGISLEPISSLVNLRQLHVAGHGKNLNVVSKLSALRELRFSRMSSPDLEFLSVLPDLWLLEFHLGSLKDLSPVARAKGLKHLQLTRIRGLADVSPIATIHSLRYLGLNQLKQVESIPEVAGLAKLKVVSLEDLKGLKDLKPLEKAPALEWLSHVSAGNLTPQDFARILCLPTLKGVHVGFGSAKKNEEFIRMAAARSLELSWRVPEDLYD